MTETINDIGIKYEDFTDIIWKNRDNLKTDEQKRIWDTTGDGTKVILEKDLHNAIIRRCKEFKCQDTKRHGEKDCKTAWIENHIKGRWCPCCIMKQDNMNFFKIKSEELE